MTQAYAYPRTAAEMIPVRRAEVEAHAHEVPSCEVHGPMEPRRLEGQTYEQLFCGVWYDCKDPRCGSSAIFASRDLAYQNGEPYYDGARYWKHDGVAWRQVSRAEAEEFFAPKRAEHDAVLRRMAARTGKSVESLYAGAAGDAHEDGDKPAGQS